MFTDDGFFSVPGYPLETVVDPTGAGDSFAGGFFGFLDCPRRAEIADRRAPLRAGLRLRAGVVRVEDFGSERVQRLTHDEIAERFEEFKRHDALRGRPLPAGVRFPDRPEDLEEETREPMVTQHRQHDVKDLALAPEGVKRIDWADRQMPVLAAIRSASRRSARSTGYRRRRLPPRDHRDREPDAHAEGGRRGRRRCARRTRSRRRTTSPRRSSPSTGSRPSRSRARTTTPTTRTSRPRSTTSRS